MVLLSSCCDHLNDALLQGVASNIKHSKVVASSGDHGDVMGVWWVVCVVDGAVLVFFGMLLMLILVLPVMFIMHHSVADVV